MMSDTSVRAQAWALFDQIVSDAAPDQVHSNPWRASGDGEPTYTPDFATLAKLLGVPLHLHAKSQSGVPALALDVWVSYELRRAGFDPDAVWPRPAVPRVLPGPVSALVESLPVKLRAQVQDRIEGKASIAGVTASSANYLGKNYFKQVDVSMSSWDTGPELLISTKRMDSSFGKNAANRVEESYGDAKNLRLRHPMAALGFLYGLRSTAFEEAAPIADWLVDLLLKLGQEDDAYHACALLVLEYSDDVAVENGDDDPGDGEDPLVDAGLIESTHGDELGIGAVEESALQAQIAHLPTVKVRQDLVAAGLQPARFMETMVRRILAATPVNRHTAARARLAEPGS
ncbi:MAG: hypothetical protein QM774_09810 [Gordonia sp. (in: high G+C Gram-positive bacteria)]|uniref:hypothetical protein n=1 Tax=Gordonia sp. (in: high G+C Gram-positive bacteria) TaxID=84139 RepID=UPI0039E3DAF3